MSEWRASISKPMLAGRLHGMCDMVIHLAIFVGNREARHYRIHKRQKTHTRLKSYQYAGMLNSGVSEKLKRVDLTGNLNTL